MSENKKKLIIKKKKSSLKKDSRKQSATIENTKFLRRKTLLSKEGNLVGNRPLKKSVKKDHLWDIENLSAKELREKYKAEYKCWDSAKQRLKKKGLRIAPEFEEFKDFLRIMGPRPDKEHSLDRIDNNNPMYAPKLCRWANKKQQSNNRGNSLYLTYKGECLPLTTWAKRTGQLADTLRRRNNKGWSDDEIITGKRKVKSGYDEDCYINIWPGDLENRRNWENSFQKYGSRKTRVEYICGKLENIYSPIVRQIRRLLNELGEEYLIRGLVKADKNGHPIETEEMKNGKVRYEQLSRRALKAHKAMMEIIDRNAPPPPPPLKPLKFS